eukprot:CAMPEP_0119158678 /NCGR_PEP_ID=MMETSP1310-20130426/53382_1 /TAXON_ID=464262 /ORGANISM="Genus nov. species nov., Strain RCC2339" /LENGTH=318 /DNA_ID=CAMNT_0007151303 /DNA_START=234 /DNA_END=1190 /DNA_ORIENTATION=-
MPATLEKIHGHCIPPFLPPLRTSEVPSSVIPGVTYFLCSWVNHFGHILMDMIFPSFLALQDLNVLGRSVRVIVDNRFTFPYGSNCTVMDAVETFLTPGTRPVELSRLLAEYRTWVKPVCFSRFVVGLKYERIVQSFTMTPWRPITVTDIRAFRDHVVSGHGARVLPEPDRSCRILILDRDTTDRRLTNVRELAQAVSASTHLYDIEVRIEKFDGMTMVAQVAEIVAADVFISVSGTGSHMAVFLPDGAASIVITTANKADVNVHLCQVATHLHCYNSTGEDTGIATPVTANIEHIAAIVRRTVVQMKHRCPSRRTHAL